MINSEFSNEFDVLYNNVMSNQAPGLDEYEKSVFLTKAQTEIIKNYLNPKGNKYQEGFDDSSKRQIDFSSIIRYDEFGKNHTATGNHFNSASARYNFPSDALIILNERVFLNRDGKQKKLTVVPISNVEYDRLNSKPFSYPLKNQVWRVTFSSNSTTYVELIGWPKDNWSEAKYAVRYVAKPLPIILIPLPDGLSIDGYIGSSGNNPVKVGGTATSGIECALDSELHPEILQRAVELAKAAYTGDINSQIQMGQRSE